MEEYWDLTREPVRYHATHFSLKARWQKVELEILTSALRKPYRGEKSGCDLLGGDASASYFSRHAVDSLGALLLDHGELLPIECRMETYYFFNCAERVSGLLDLGRIELREGGLPTPPPVLNITGQLYFLTTEKVLPPIFRLAEEPMRGIYASDEFKQAVERLKLTGFSFRELEEGKGYS